MTNLIYEPPSDPFLDIQYTDDDLLVVSKPTSLLSVPGRNPNHADSIQTRAQSLHPEATIVHRLDLETSGVMILARNPAAHRHLSWQFERRQIEKVYQARVWGRTDEPSGEINAPLICDWPNRPRQMVDHEQGRAAQTEWQIIEYEDNATRVRLAPKTGRSHQLRVHMLSIGHPILGDPLYGHLEAREASERLQLHAQQITFKHPHHEDMITFSDKCPF